MRHEDLRLRGGLALERDAGASVDLPTVAIGALTLLLLIKAKIREPLLIAAAGVIGLVVRRD